MCLRPVVTDLKADLVPEVTPILGETDDGDPPLNRKIGLKDYVWGAGSAVVTGFTASTFLRLFDEGFARLYLTHTPIPETFQNLTSQLGAGPLWDFRQTVKTDGVKGVWRNASFSPKLYYHNRIFAAVFGVYALATYGIKNFIDLTGEYLAQDLKLEDQKEVRRKTALVNGVGTTVANGLGCVLKESVIAKEVIKEAINQGRSVAQLPKVAGRPMSMLMTRDAITGAGAIAIPPLVGQWVADNTSYSFETGQRAAQWVVPIGSQFVTTIPQLTAYWMIQNPEVTFSDLIAKPECRASYGAHVKRLYVESVKWRLGRIGVAFAGAGDLNTTLMGLRFRVFESELWRGIFGGDDSDA